MLPVRPPNLLISLTALVLANLVPLAGAVWLGWSVLDIMMLFWLENVIIGAFNVLRMGAVMVSRGEWAGLFLIPFFTLHYGIFCAAHGFFLLAVLGGGEPSVSGFAMRLASWDGLLLGVIGLVASHGVSFVVNFLIGGEVRRVGLDTLMSAPYARIMILHVTIILGFIATMAFGSSVAMLALLVGLKIIVDAWAHRREHARWAAAA
jgi:hypothetical protein